MSVVLIRADGSHHIGFGHIMRCIALAEGLRDLGFTPLFIVRDYGRVASEKIRGRNFWVESFPQEWTSEQDLEYTLKHVRRHRARYVVMDLYPVPQNAPHVSAGKHVLDLPEGQHPKAADASPWYGVYHADILQEPDSRRRYVERLRQSGVFLMTIVDFNEGMFPADVVLNPNYGAGAVVPAAHAGTSYLLGEKYFLFRSEFIASSGQPREIRRRASRILITMGGSDLLGLTSKVVQALARLDADPPLELCVVLGLEDEKQRELSRALAGFSHPPVTLVDPDNMDELMLWCDLAITAGGLTKYETAVTGTPSVVLSQAPHQALIMERFSNAGTTVHLGYGPEVREDAIAEVVHALLNDYPRRREMSLAGKQLVDGKGLERVLQAFRELISQGSLSLGAQKT